ncbi:4-hydroxy-tetrahydrodipicolinate reductase [Fictibacillus nanhaiensis]|uniref:4-hydroxy-tetrahydrodipicolinate reductase n=1 Tax=Fictibacillus nanhaiensis TaxID=742169 RepID=UPI001C981C34|nr:4-hydroxy-tetrahydrodipicolinate reductase [Fictibacillus nanhaiensis]MBY6035714.1 4-hydroxy-tetrahydrodipicolinate reductase [Fictibacillus nanhaiensis]
MNKVKIILAGPRGKMGLEALKMISETPQFELVAAIDSRNDGLQVKDLTGAPNSMDATVYDDIERCLDAIQADVLIDLTKPDIGKRHLEIALNYGVRTVIGTTGFTNEDLERLSQLAHDKKTGAIIAPNFAIGAILMMKFSQMAAKYLPDIEIIEKHHDQKLDAPSGTALKTAQLITEVREAKGQGHPDETEELTGSRGAEWQGIRIHSVRLPGLVAHQEVMFGGEGQLLTIRHDSMNRASFMPGVKMAIEHVMHIEGLVYGLENIME